MSVRVGHILRHEDVHGISGTGKVADVWEASNGVCVVVWRSANSSTNVYPNIKALEATHSHGGKTLVIWDWESPPEPDPMDRILNADKPELTEAEIDQISEEAAEEVSRVAAAKVAEKIAEKVAEAQEENGVGPVVKEPRKNGDEKEKE